MANTPRRPRDANQLAKMIVDLATGAACEAGANQRQYGAGVSLFSLGNARRR